MLDFENTRWLIFMSLLLINVTTSSPDAEGPCDVPQIRNVSLEKACNMGMTFKANVNVITTAAIR